MQVLLFPSCYILFLVKSFLNLLFVPPFPVHTVTEVKKRRVLGILRDDRIATLKKSLSKIPEDKVKEVYIEGYPIL